MSARSPAFHFATRTNFDLDQGSEREENTALPKPFWNHIPRYRLTSITDRFVAFIGDRETNRAPAPRKQGAAPCLNGVVSSKPRPLRNA